MTTKRTSPGIGRAGHNSGLPSHADVRSALAIEMIFEEEAKKLRERHKRARKRIEGMGVRLDDLKYLKGMQDMTGSEVEAEFTRHWHLVGAIHEDKFEQLDIFAPKPAAPAVRAAHFTMGLLAGLKGADLEIPPAVVGDERQQMQDGYNEGCERRAEAWKLAAETDGQAPVDGTGKTPSAKAAKVAEQAAKDFVQDQGEDPLTVGGVAYPNMRQANAARTRLAAGPQVAVDNTKPQAVAGDTVTGDGSGASLPPLVDGEESVLVEGVSPARIENTALQEQHPEFVDRALAATKAPVLKPDFHDWAEDYTEWTGAQSMEIRRWLESQADGFVPLSTHEGVGAYWRLWKEEKAEAAAAAAPPQAQAAELPDHNEVEAAAKKLAESGFVPPKAGRKPRNLAK